MNDAASGGHEIHRTRRDLLDVSLAVAMQDLAVEEVGDGRQANVRMRPNIQPLPSDKLNRAEMIEEDKRPHHLTLAVREGPSDLEPTEITNARDDHQFEGVAGSGITEDGVMRWKPAHLRALPSELRFGLLQSLIPSLAM